MKPIVYIAGPIRHKDHMEMLVNLSHFFKAEGALIKAGMAPLNPASDLIACIVRGDLSLQEVLTKDEPFVRTSDGALLLPGWKDSKGALVEYDWMVEECIPRIEVIDMKHLDLAIKALSYKLGLRRAGVVWE